MAKRGGKRWHARAAGLLVAIGAFVAVTALPALAAVPTVSQVWPATAAPGCQVTITGTNFITNGGPVTGVKFGTTAATMFSIDADTQLEATIPSSVPASTSEPVVLTNSSGDSASFAFSTGPSATCPGAPSFTPTSGTTGTTVTITGTFNLAPTAVRFNTSALIVPTSSSATSVTAVVPSDATTGPIRIYTTAGAASSATNFTVSAAPTITSFTPTSGPVGTVVTITGTGFTGATSVKFNGVEATTKTVNNDTTITASVPSGATSGKITVTTPAGTATSAKPFKVTGVPGAVHKRTVSLQLKPRRALGTVVATDGYTACENWQPVLIQRRKPSGAWRRIELLSTNGSGHYSGLIPGGHGTYRARAVKVTLDSGAVCGGATSPIRRK